jgi:hypothetical protein
MFTANTTTARKQPGKKIVHGAIPRYRREDAIMFPHIGILGGIPVPRNDNPASTKIGEAQT